MSLIWPRIGPRLRNIWAVNNIPEMFSEWLKIFANLALSVEACFPSSHRVSSWNGCHQKGKERKTKEREPGLGENKKVPYLSHSLYTRNSNLCWLGDIAVTHCSREAGSI